uniref:NADH-ubiquinone oxidoreductase chain 2 n=1 Tax=Onisimus nanseni TaxID=583350 RepID=D3G9L5_ONINA|nr:NADH dehydrogenase subunit 2 [Onisimus nanseni]
MPIHPTYLMFWMSLPLSIALSLSSDSWLLVWVGLEINLMCFTPIITQNTNKLSAECALKYFLVQALASTAIVFCAVLGDHPEITMPVTLAALMWKSGAAPLHQSMPSIVSGLTWAPMTALLSIQKIIPLSVLTSLSSYFMLKKFFFFFILFSAFIGSIGGLTQTSLRKILIFSSIAHLAWLLSAILLSNWLWLNYFLIYFFIVMSITIPLNKSNTYSLNQLILAANPAIPIMTSISLLSLGGLPPFTGFLPKLMVVQHLVGSISVLLPFFLLLSTFISLFFYLRVAMATLFFLTSSKILLKMIFPFGLSVMTLNLMALLVSTLFFMN